MKYIDKVTSLRESIVADLKSILLKHTTVLLLENGDVDEDDPFNNL